MAKSNEKPTSDDADGVVGVTTSVDTMPPAESLEDNENGGDALHKSTQSDVAAMNRMGRKQELVRHFRMVSMVSFVVIGGAGWEGTIFAFAQALINGGRPQVIYSHLWCFVGYIPVYLSLAEMASMAPIAGAQYHWVSEFAPEKAQKILSYLTGWISTLAWQAYNASGFLQSGMIIQTLINIHRPDYTVPNWLITVLTIFFTVAALATNVLGHKALPYWQNPVFALHTVVFIVFIAAIWVAGPTPEPHEKVWLHFENYGGWPNMAMTVLVGQLPGILANIGSDKATHMSEELRDAPRTIPRVIMYNFFLDMFFILVTEITFVYHIPDIQEALEDSTGYPGMWIIRHTMSLPCITVLLVFVCILQFFSNLSYFAAVTRDLYGFTRDNGFPFSPWICRIDQKRRIPTNAYLLSAFMSGLLSLIFIGSSVAYFAILSLGTIAMLQCYMFSIGCILWRRIYHKESLPYTPFSLGRWGPLINSLGLAFTVWSFFWCTWPTAMPVTAENMNWSGPIFGATLIVGFIYYGLVARKSYHGPVTLVEGRKNQ